MERDHSPRGKVVYGAHRQNNLPDPTGLEPMRHDVNRFLVDRLNHSATAPYLFIDIMV